MSAWPTHFHAITSRSQRSIRNPINTWTIKTQKRIDVIGPTSFRKQMTNATQVSLALFAHSSDKQNRTFERYSFRLNRLRECEQCDESTTIISNAGRKQLVRAPRDFEARVFWKDGIEMGADDDQRRSR